MLTFRKSLFAALFMVLCIFYLRSSHADPSSSSSVTQRLHDGGGGGEPADDRASSSSSSSQIQGGGGNNQQQKDQQKNDKVPTTTTTAEESQQEQQQGRQKLLTPPSNAPLRERLRYQYSYDVKRKFPAYIWQTWKYTPASMWFPMELRPDEASWTELNPGFAHEVVPDDVQHSLVKHLYAPIPEIIQAFEALPLSVLKADFFRYLILLARGGIYSDIDTAALQPAVDWLPHDLDQSTVGLVIGIEADPDRPDWHEWYSRRIQFCQWTVQAKPGHPILRDIVAIITEETLQMLKKIHGRRLDEGSLEKTVVEFTGPAAWTDAIFRYFNNPDYFNVEPGKNVTYANFTGMVDRKKVGDVVVLPITSFSPGVMQMGANDVDDPMAFVRHNFGGKSFSRERVGLLLFSFLFF